MEYRYKLASNRLPKLVCPSCGKAKHWQQYIDIETGDALPSQFGQCDNANKCGYACNPYSAGYKKEEWFKKDNTQPKAKPKQKPVCMPIEILRTTMQPERYARNTFVQNLYSRIAYPFPVEDLAQVTYTYRLGTIVGGYRAGAVTFPFIDSSDNVRTIQAKQFDSNNHTISTDFVHSMLTHHYRRCRVPIPDWLRAYNAQELKVSCLFGEHLLKYYPKNPVALVEAPKTAAYCSLYYGLPSTDKDILWLAVYNKSSYTAEKVKVLQGRQVYVFPDLSFGARTLRDWEAKSNIYEAMMTDTRFTVCDLLDRFARPEDKQDGKDIADYLIKHDWRKFRTRAS